MFAILSELCSAVRKDDECGVDELPPRNNPLSVCFNGLGCFGTSDNDFELSNSFGAPVVAADRVHRGENVIDVDSSSVQDIGPFRIGELR